MGQDTAFAALVSLACHDLRTPLATVQGFARVLTRSEDLADPLPRYLGMMATASQQMAELLDDLGLVARIEGRRWEPAPREVDTLELVQAAAARVTGAAVGVEGVGARTTLDADVAERALVNFAQGAIRHGGLDRLAVAVDGPVVRMSPVAADVGPVLTGENLRDLGAAVAGRAVAALGGTAALDGDALEIRLPVVAG